MSISFKGYGENVLTFNTTLTKVGIPVMVSSDCRVVEATTDRDFMGITCYADGELAGVIMDGYVEMTYTGSIPTLGYCNLVADGSGGVKAAASGASSNHIVRVLKVDAENKTVGFIL